MDGRSIGSPDCCGRRHPNPSARQARTLKHTRSRTLRQVDSRVRGNPFPEGGGLTISRSIPARAGEPVGAHGDRRPGKVYPRACGGTEQPTETTAIPSGLSPRVRGNPGRPAGTTPSPGSIPARAGEPETPVPSPRPEPVYPRACGGTDPGLVYLVLHPGLSPRVRGNLQVCQEGVLSLGSIPARAGEPPTECGSRWPTRVYPRACGGTLEPIAVKDTDTGLSPRVRGNLSSDFVE